jgi:hypothetical protein
VHAAEKPGRGFFDAPGNPRIPGLVRGYGTFIRMLHIVLLFPAGLLLLVASGAPSPEIGAFQVAPFVYSGFMVWVGGAMRDGRLAGIQALVAVSALQISGGILLAGAGAGGAYLAVVTVVVVGIMYGPPIAVALHNWEKFE